jgi:hypothetical protein
LHPSFFGRNDALKANHCEGSLKTPFAGGFAFSNVIRKGDRPQEGYQCNQVVVLYRLGW